MRAGGSSSPPSRGMGGRTGRERPQAGNRPAGWHSCPRCDCCSSDKPLETAVSDAYEVPLVSADTEHADHARLIAKPLYEQIEIDNRNPMLGDMALSHRVGARQLARVDLGDVDDRRRRRCRERFTKQQDRLVLFGSADKIDEHLALRKVVHEPLHSGASGTRRLPVMQPLPTHRIVRPRACIRRSGASDCVPYPRPATHPSASRMGRSGTVDIEVGRPTAAPGRPSRSAAQRLSGGRGGRASRRRR